MRDCGCGEFKILYLCGYWDCVKETQQVEHSFPSHHFSCLFNDFFFKLILNQQTKIQQEQQNPTKYSEMSNRHRTLQAMFGQTNYIHKWHLIGEKGHKTSKIRVALKVLPEL